MFITAGILTLVCCIYFCVLFWTRANQANQEGWKWGLGALIGYDLGIAVLLLLEWLITSALGFSFFVQSALAVVIWFFVTLYAGRLSDKMAP